MNKRILWKYEKINFIKKGTSKGNPRVSGWHYFRKTKQYKKEYLANVIPSYKKAFRQPFLITHGSNVHRHKLWRKLKKREYQLEDNSN